MEPPPPLSFSIPAPNRNFPVLPPTPTVRPNFHLNMERSLDFDTSWMRFASLPGCGSAESRSSGSDKAPRSLPVNFDTYTVTCCLLGQRSLRAGGGESVGKSAVCHFCKCSIDRMRF